MNQLKNSQQIADKDGKPQGGDKSKLGASTEYKM